MRGAVLVTGGAGYVGSHIVRALREVGREVWVLDNLIRGHAAAVPRDVPLYKLSCSRIEKVARMWGLDTVIHTAAFALARESMELPGLYYENNVAQGIEMLRHLTEEGVVKRVIFSSTGSLYGSSDRAFREDDPPCPANPYAHTKVIFEDMLRWFAGAGGPSYVCLRYFNVAGAHPSGEIGEDHRPETHIIPSLLRAAMTDRKAVLYDPGKERDFVHVCDVARAHVLALEALESGEAHNEAFNVGLGFGYTMRDVVRSVERVTGVKLELDLRPGNPADPDRIVADPTKIEERLGFTADYPGLDQMVETAWEWMRAHPNGYER